MTSRRRLLQAMLALGSTLLRVSVAFNQIRSSATGPDILLRIRLVAFPRLRG